MSPTRNEFLPAYVNDWLVVTVSPRRPIYKSGLQTLNRTELLGHPGTFPIPLARGVHCCAIIPQDNVAELGVGEYSLSQISLEQIFNGFASEQQEEQGRAAGIV